MSLWEDLYRPEGATAHDGATNEFGAMEESFDTTIDPSAPSTPRDERTNREKHEDRMAERERARAARELEPEQERRSMADRLNDRDAERERIARAEQEKLKADREVLGATSTRAPTTEPVASTKGSDEFEEIMKRPDADVDVSTFQMVAEEASVAAVGIGSIIERVEMLESTSGSGVSQDDFDDLVYRVEVLEVVS